MTTKPLLVMLACAWTGCTGPAENASGSGGDSVQPDARTAEPDAPAVLPTCETRTAQPENATWTLTVDGSQRTARIHVPPGYKPSERTPVVLNLHGLNSNATHQEYLSKMIAKSNAEGFIAVHPQGKGNSWNAGSCCGTASSTNVDDIKFLSALLDELEAKLCVDPDRVYATGLSNGGHMAHRLGCELSERIAAIAPVAGLKMFAACAPERAVPVFAVHGDDDGIVSYSFVPATINYWKNHNACTSTQTTSQNGDATCVTHGNCTGGADVELCTIANGGHQWPGGYAIVGLGIKSDDLIATDAIWSFFVAHPRGAL